MLRVQEVASSILASPHFGLSFALVKKCVELASEPLFFDIFCDNGLSVIQVVCPGTSFSKVKDLLRPGLEKRFVFDQS